MIRFHKIHLRVSNFWVRISIVLLLLAVSYYLCMIMVPLTFFRQSFEDRFISRDKALSFALCKLGCSGGLTFAIVFAVRAMITGEAESIKMMMSPTGADSGASGASGSESSSPSEAKNESNFSFEFHQLQDKTFSAFQNLIYYDNNFLKYLHCLNNRAGCLFSKFSTFQGWNETTPEDRTFTRFGNTLESQQRT